MQQYLDACRYIVDNGVDCQGRNGKYRSVNGMMMKFNMADGFPAVTTKKLQFKSVVAELLGFIRGADNVKEFNELGTKIWDMNAFSEQWLMSPFNKGNGDLGHIYSAQWRDWRGVEKRAHEINETIIHIDQLRLMVDKLKRRVEDRRNIVLAWNPAEIHQAALPACHALFQAHIQGEVLSITLYQRSADAALGAPFNVASYALLLHILCRISGLQPGTLTWMGGDCHIYINQLELMETVQLQRTPGELPSLWIDPALKTLEDFETAGVLQFALRGYEHQGAINYPFSV